MKRQPINTQGPLYILAFALLAVFIAALGISSAFAQVDGQIITPQGSYENLQEALAEANDGDEIEVHGGLFQGQIVIDRPLILTGHEWPIIDGGGRGTVITVVAPEVTIEGFEIRNSGDSLDQENSGIAVEAPGAIINGNRLKDTLFGVYLREADDSVISNNEITSKDLDVPRRGDSIRVWFSNDVTVENNQIIKGRDVVLWYSERLTVRNNVVREGRYGLHFMYCDDALIEGNLLTNNSVGTFLMYSRRLNLINNTIAHNRGPSGFGVGLKDMDDAIIKNNLFLDNRIGAKLDNSPREVDSVGRFEGNVFAFNDVGVTLMPSVRHNQFVGNSFVDNEEQVSIAGRGGRAEDNAWNEADLGNYWSDYVGYDGDANGLGDIPYTSERLFENLTDNNSSLRLFLYSPVEQAVDFAARAIPFVKPKPKLTDESPLMAPQMPTDLPVIPETNNGSILLLSMAMILLAIVILSLGRGKRQGLEGLRSRLNRSETASGFTSHLS
jgi:nitrous oxidase accessory protein